MLLFGILARQRVYPLQYHERQQIHIGNGESAGRRTLEPLWNVYERRQLEDDELLRERMRNGDWEDWGDSELVGGRGGLGPHGQGGSRAIDERLNRPRRGQESSNRSDGAGNSNWDREHRGRSHGSRAGRQQRSVPPHARLEVDDTATVLCEDRRPLYHHGSSFGFAVGYTELGDDGPANVDEVEEIDDVPPVRHEIGNMLGGGRRRSDRCGDGESGVGSIRGPRSRHSRDDDHRSHRCGDSEGGVGSIQGLQSRRVRDDDRHSDGSANGEGGVGSILSRRAQDDDQTTETTDDIRSDGRGARSRAGSKRSRGHGHRRR